MQIKDSVRDCLEKDPKERNEDDIDTTLSGIIIKCYFLK